MPVMCVYRAPGVTPEDYEKIRSYLQWELNPPKGGLGHFISFKHGEAVEIDIWESVEEFRDYYNHYFKPALRHFGLPVGRPEILNLYNVAVAPSIEAHVLAPENDKGRTPDKAAKPVLGQLTTHH